MQPLDRNLDPGNSEPNRPKDTNQSQADIPQLSESLVNEPQRHQEVAVNIWRDLPYMVAISNLEFDKLYSSLKLCQINLKEEGLRAIIEALKTSDNISPESISYNLEEDSFLGVCQERIFQVGNGSFKDSVSAICLESENRISWNLSYEAKDRFVLRLYSANTDNSEAWKFVSEILKELCDTDIEGATDHDGYLNITDSFIEIQAGHAIITIAPNIIIYTTHIPEHMEGVINAESTGLVVQDIKSKDFELCWIPNRVQLYGLSTLQKEAIFALFKDENLSHLAKTRLIETGFEIAEDRRTIHIDDIWPLAKVFSSSIHVSVERKMYIGDSDNEGELYYSGQDESFEDQHEFHPNGFYGTEIEDIEHSSIDSSVEDYTPIQNVTAEFTVRGFNSKLGFTTLTVLTNPNWSGSMPELCMDSFGEGLHPQKPVLQISWNTTPVSGNNALKHRESWRIIERIAEITGQEKFRECLEQAIEQGKKPSLLDTIDCSLTNMMFTIQHSQASKFT